MAVVKLHTTRLMKPLPRAPQFKPGMLTRKPAVVLHADAPFSSGDKWAQGRITFKFMTQHPNFIDGNDYKTLVDILKGQIGRHEMQRCVCSFPSFEWQKCRPTVLSQRGRVSGSVASV